MVTQHTSSVVSANISGEFIEHKIYMIRGYKVMLDSDLAELYQVETRVINQATKRNLERFPGDFMFQITKQEVKNLTSQIATSSSRSQSVILNQGENLKYLPYAFTEHGIAMLSSVLRSKRAIEMNISIMRAFIAIRRANLNLKDIQEEIEILKIDNAEHWKQTVSLRDIVVQIINPPPKPKLT